MDGEGDQTQLAPMQPEAGKTTQEQLDQEQAYND